MSEIKRAIIPAAGHGTRLRPLTYGVPKELLVVAYKPMIHYSVLECIEAKVQEIIIIVNKKKHGIAEYLENVFKDVCKLTSDNCGNALAKYEEHENLLTLVADVFSSIDKCDSQKCKDNKDTIVKKLNTFLEEQ